MMSFAQTCVLNALHIALDPNNLNEDGFHVIENLLAIGGSSMKVSDPAHLLRVTR